MAAIEKETPKGGDRGRNRKKKLGKQLGTKKTPNESLPVALETKERGKSREEDEEWPSRHTRNPSTTLNTHQTPSKPSKTQ